MTKMTTVLLVQASMEYVDTRVGQDVTDIDYCLTRDMQMEFAALEPLCVSGICNGHLPGVLSITDSSEHMWVVGNMSSLTAEQVKLCESLARTLESPLAPFLNICARHNLCLNKCLKTC